MLPNATCPRCGRPLADGHCLFCEAAAGGSVIIFPAKDTGRREAKFVLFALALYLAFAALVVFAGFFYVRKNLPRWSHIRSPQPNPVRHTGPVARLDELRGEGRIYLVQMGRHEDPYSLSDFAAWLHTKYAIDVRVLDPMGIDNSAWDPNRKQFIAESLYAQLKLAHPDLSADPNACLIAFTDADMYSVRYLWRSTFTQRDGRRAAIISSDGMRDSPQIEKMIGSYVADQRFQARMRRILLKDVAILYWHLPVNDDPTSLLHNTLNPNLPVEDIFESDLDPARSPEGQKLSEPCIFFEYSSRLGIRPMAGPLIRECSDVEIPSEDTDLERFEVDPRFGLLINRRTDGDLPDTTPIQFERVTRDGWKGINPFGISGTDNYDSFLASADNITISIIYADGGQEKFVKQPRWAPLGFARFLDSTQPGFLEMRWRATPYEHYEVRRFDGTIWSFLPCEGPIVHCFLTDYRDSQGHELKFERGDQRRLVRLVSQDGNWLRIDYDSTGRIAEITDGSHRTVHYGYDPANQLTSVSYPSGEVCSYVYDSTHHLLGFSSVPDRAKPRLLWMHNDYSDGLLVKQSFPDDQAYSYSYHRTPEGQIESVTVLSPDGRVFDITVSDAFSVVHER